MEHIQPEYHLSRSEKQEFVDEVRSVAAFVRGSMYNDRYETKPIVTHTGSGSTREVYGVIDDMTRYSKADPGDDRYEITFVETDKVDAAVLDESLREDLLVDAEAVYQYQAEEFEVGHRRFSSVIDAARTFPYDAHIIVESREVFHVGSEHKEPMLARDFMVQRLFSIGNLRLEIDMVAIEDEIDEDIQMLPTSKIPPADLILDTRLHADDADLRAISHDYTQVTRDDIEQLRKLFAHFA